MQKYRPLIFWLFLIFFCVTVVSFLLYAFGYRFSPDRGIFIYTGSLTLKSNPQTVTISIDGQTVPKKRLGTINNSYHVPGLSPGEHFIQVTAPGYSAWQKKVVIQSGVSTEFWNVLLAKGSPDLLALPGSSFAVRIFPSPRANILAVAKERDGELSVDMVNTRTGSQEEVFSLPAASLPPEKSPDSIAWSPDGRRLLVTAITGASEPRHFIVDISSRAAVSPSAFAGASDLRWDPAGRDFLLYRSGRSLLRLDTAAADPSPSFLQENVLAYDVSGENVYYLSGANGIVYRENSAAPDEGAVQIATEPLPTAPDSDYSLTVYDDRRLAFLDRSVGKLWVLNDAADSGPVGVRALAASDVMGIQFSDDGKKLLYFTSHEINTYFFRDWDVQPTRTADSVSQIARFSEAIANVQWTKDYEHVLFTAGGSAKMIELDNRDQRNLLDLASFPAPLNQVVSRFSENKLYFLIDRESGGERISAMEFPTPSALFGLLPQGR